MKNKDFWDHSGKVLLTIALLLGFTSLSLNLSSRYFEKKNPVNTEGTIQPKETIQVINVLGGGQAVYGKSITNDDYTVVVEGLDTLVHNYDVSVYTQNSLIGTEVSTQFGDAMKNIGFKAVSLATPQSMKFDKPGIETSLSYWNNSGLYVTGNYLSTDQQNLIPHFEVNGISVVVLSFTEKLDNALPDYEQYLVNVYDDVRSLQIVEQASYIADVVIVSMAWDGIHNEQPTERQQQIAKALADAGASVILGNAGSAIQPVHWIDDTLIFYGMGNLVSDAFMEEDRIGLVGGITITKSTYYDKTKIELTNPRMDLVYSILEPNGYYSTKLFSSLSEEELTNKDEIYQTYRSFLQSMDDSIRMGGLQ
ncbi:MAG: CapA family protein [Solobacterium sp.]|nr:CapA family protein [Solobacterium sp.]